MKKLIVVLLAFALPVAADGPVVCSETPQSPGTACSATAVSATNCVCASAEEAEPEPSVYDDAIALWKLDEASGTRADSIGSNDLTDNNTVGSAAKGAGAPANLPDTVASFVAANSEYLSQASALINWTESWTLSLWVNLGDTGGFRGLFGVHSSGSSSARAYSNAGGGIITLEGGAGGPNATKTVTAGTWAHLILWHDDASDELGFALNNDTPHTVTKDITVNGNVFHLGSTGSTANPYDGKVSSVAIWSRVLTADERTALYNSGDGAPLP